MIKANDNKYPTTVLEQLEKCIDDVRQLKIEIARNNHLFGDTLYFKVIDVMHTTLFSLEEAIKEEFNKAAIENNILEGGKQHGTIN